MRLVPYGDRALLVQVDDVDAALACASVVRDRAASSPDLLDDVVPGAASVLLVAAEGTDPAALAALVPDPETLRAAAGGAPAEGGEVVVPVHYDGADLDEVAGLTGLTPREVVAAHTGRVWRAAFAGFAPGFVYLVDGDPRLEVPRRAAPRPRVPAGAVGLAGTFSGVYPRASPGGWQLIGRTDVALWDLERDPPALLGPGTRVRFEAI